MLYRLASPLPGHAACYCNALLVTSVSPVSVVLGGWSGRKGCSVSASGNRAVQVEDALYFVPNPFPEDQLVGVTKQTLAIVDDTTRAVPLSEV